MSSRDAACAQDAFDDAARAAERKRAHRAFAGARADQFYEGFDA